MTDIQLKCFLALAEEMNFTKAAKRMNISQSTFSTHIKALEKNLNLTLFIRTKRSVSLSPEGESFLPKLREITKMMDNAVVEAHNLHAEHENILRVGYSSVVGSNQFLFDMIDDFKRNNPRVQFVVSRMPQDKLIGSIMDNELDIGFCHDKNLEIKSGVEGTVIFESPLGLLCQRKKYGDTEALAAEMLKDEPFICLRRDMDSIEERYLNEMVLAYENSPQKIIYVNSVEAQLFGVVLGQGVCLSDHSSRAIDDERYLFVSLDKVRVRLDALRKKDTKHPIVKQFFDFLSEKGYEYAT